jgi:hypothetical protein
MRPTLGEVQLKPSLETWIKGGQQRLHHIVEQMAEADGEQHREGRDMDRAVRKRR